MKNLLRFTIALSLVLAIPLVAQAEQLEGFKVPDKGKKGVFSPGLIRGYTENQVIPFKANVDAKDLLDAEAWAVENRSSSQYMISLMIPTYSDHTKGPIGEANAESECLFGVPVTGHYPHDASVGNYKLLPAPAEAPEEAKDLLKGGGAFTFGVVAYQPAQGDWEGSDAKHIGVINLVENRFFMGHPVFPNGVTGLIYDVHFDIDPAKLPQGKGKQEDPPPACTIQYGVRLAAGDLQPIVPPSHPDHGTDPVPGACSFHPGPGLLHAAYEVGHPTGRATVPIKCSPYEEVLLKICGVKWDDSAIDHVYNMGLDSTIAGVRIDLYLDGCGGRLEDSRYTDESGHYCVWTTVPVGSTVTLVVQEDSAGPGETLDNILWVQTTPQLGCDGEPIPADWFDVGLGVYIEEFIQVTADETREGRNFGNIPPKPVTVEGTKWCDFDLDHTYDAGDLTLSGVQIELRGGGCLGDLLDHALTDELGSYSVTTYARYGDEISLVVLEDSTGVGETLDATDFWSQTTPQTDCDGNPIYADWFTVGAGVYHETVLVLGDVLLEDRDFGNVRLAFGEVGERTPGFWCSQVRLEKYGQGGSQPCNDLIRSCGVSTSAEDRLNRAIDAWETSYCDDGLNRWIFADRLGKPQDTGQYYSLDDLEEILCPAAGDAEKHQLARQLLALMANVTDCPCTGEPCGSVGSPNCDAQMIYLNGQITTVAYALEMVCDGNLTHEDIAAINENRITLVVHDCGP